MGRGQHQLAPINELLTNKENDNENAQESEDE